MKLIKSLYIAGAVALGATFTSCTEWLNYEPKDQQTFDQQFSTAEGFHSTLNGIYTNLCSGSLYGSSLSYGVIDVMGNLYDVPSNNTSMYEIVRGTYTGSNASSMFTNIWTAAYKSILNVNILLEAIDTKGEAVLTPNDAKMMRAELLGIRGYLHLDLVRIFGPCYARNKKGLTVPYAESTEIVRRERLPLDSIVYSKIIPDLEAAQTALAEVDPILTEGVLNTDGGEDGNWNRYRQIRMNYYAVTLLKARAYMWVNDWANALVEARKITDDEKAKSTFPWVVPSKLLGNNSNPDRGFSTECLFGFYNKSLSNIYTNSFSGNLQPYVGYHVRKGYIGKVYKSDADYRRQSQWESSLSASFDVDFIKFKGFEVNKTTPEFWGTFFGLMRTSEAYLITAECLQRTGDLAGARTYIDILHKARGLEPMAESANAATILKEIKLETVRDLWGEGQVFFLHKRNWQAFGAYSAGGDQDFDGSGTSSMMDSPSTSIRYTVPIPAGENF